MVYMERWHYGYAQKSVLLVCLLKNLTFKVKGFRKQNAFALGGSRIFKFWPK